MSSIYRFGILTCSDRCSSGVTVDESGPFLREAIETCDKLFSVIKTAIVPDDRATIESVLVQWSDQGDIDCVLTTGGSGLSERDVTPEATKAVAHREAPGLMHAIMAESLRATPMAMLSRLVAVIRNRTLIINFPGSKKACRECFAVIRPILSHAIDQLRNDRIKVDGMHCTIQQEDKSKVKMVAVADRYRRSQYEMISMHTAFDKVVDQVKFYFESKNDDMFEKIFAESFHICAGRTLSEDIFAVVPLPPFAASIKDGYAVIAEDGAGLRRVLNRSSVAGDGENHNLPPLVSGFCVRISTGAAVPVGADAVVQVEDTELVTRTQDGSEEAEIKIKTVPKVGQDIRAIGSDISLNRSTPLLAKYSQLSPVECGLLSSAGVPSVSVYRRPTVAVMSTGDEVVSPGQPRPRNCIWDSNRAVLIASLRASQHRTIDIGIVKDNVDAIYRGIKRAFNYADVLITTGGVSMGERDLLKSVLKEDFDAIIHFGRVNLKPGKPTTFATCMYTGKRKFIFALPGNPVSAFVTYQVFVKPTLDFLGGQYFSYEKQRSIGQGSLSLLAAHRTVKCKLVLPEPYRLDSRPEFVRAIITFPHVNGDKCHNPLDYFPTAALTESNQISSRLLNAKDANALILFPSPDENGNQQFLNNGSLLYALLF